MKWEDNIKKTLEERTLEPSAASWDTLAGKLDTVNKKRSKTPYWWVGIAASIVAILFTVNVLFDGKSAEIQNPIIVDTQEQVEEQSMPMENQPVVEQVAATHQEDERRKPVEKKPSKKKLLKTQNDLMPPVEKNSSVANTEKETIEPLDANRQKEILEDKKISEILAQIQDLKNKGQTVTDADIDALLDQAQKEIKFQTMTQEGTLTVDANALLQDVEYDLQQSFRKKIFEALKSSYETIKTAVAERKN
ncbi:hypothetical protein [Gelidibacter maritimus]|uniref:Uncharacterized protein n=1 Tax=Gelidibacter maritimus TaxID=2761487 RepID=A0A7W2M7F0_9FLAO|nr:hypothetical protein [Gelidibacter maritimus]MBA6154104.1 hypothetical protein [Gelidibacter maritimus]